MRNHLFPVGGVFVNVNPTHRLVRGTDLKNGKSKSCGCYNNDIDKAKNELGNQYGRLTVFKRGSNSIDGSAKWWCICECGSLKEILAGSLRQGLSTSCGCAQKESVKKYFSDPKNLQKRKDNHIQKINSFKRVKLVGKYERDDINTEYKCLLHDEIHFAKPTNVARGFGLKCCQLSAITETSNKKKSEAEGRYFKSIKNKFELLEKYAGKEIKILHYCLKHKEIHLASPAQINKGSGLKCCGREKLKINGRKKSEKAA